MGQAIQIKGASTIGEVTVFELNRSLTGQAGESYDGPESAELVNTLPGVLARRLFGAIPTVDHVYAAGSLVSVRDSAAWASDAREKVEYELRNFFTHWDENRS